MRSRIIAVLLVAAVGCYSEPAPNYQQEFGGLGAETRAAWLAALQDRYGCDSVYVKMDAHPPLSIGVPTCDAARWVQPDVVRAWHDTTGVREEWEYLGDATGSGPWERPWMPRQGRCTLVLRGPTAQLLHVTQEFC